MGGGQNENNAKSALTKVEVKVKAELGKKSDKVSLKSPFNIQELIRFAIC